MAEQYSHRNGEAEAPFLTGNYWFKGKIYHADYSHDVAGLIEVQTKMRGQYEYWFIPGEECEHVLKDAEGQWWGPVITPWEEND